MRYDTLIVGSGSAGAVLATRLSEDPARRVALVEAGPDFPDFEAAPEALRSHREASAEVTSDPHGGRHEFDWNLVARATASRPEMVVRRGKVIGGSSSINGSMFVRGTREDFDSWAEAGNTEWSYAKVLPFFRKLETDLDFQNGSHGSSGPMPVARAKRSAWNELDLAFEAACLGIGQPACQDHNSPDSTGVGPVPRNSVDGRRMSTARTYLATARARQNLTVLGDTLALRVHFRSRRAIGIDAWTAGAPARLIEADEVVLCAGAIGTPQVLLLSGVGPAPNLQRLGIPVVCDLPGVGHGLRDHPGVKVVWRGAEGDVQLGSLYLRFTGSGSSWKNDCRVVCPNKDATGFASTHVGLYLAAGSGDVRLRSTDPSVQPDVDLRYLDEEADRRRMRECVSVAIELAQSPSLRPMLGTLVAPTRDDLASEEALDAWMSRVVKTSHHLSSTAKMGPTGDRTTVVDQFGRVHGLDGLRVADASIMPNCVSHNTNMSTIMIAERIADMMRGAVH